MNASPEALFFKDNTPAPPPWSWLLPGILQVALGAAAVAMAFLVHLTDENRDWYINHNFYLCLILLLSGGGRLLLAIGLRRAPGVRWFVAQAVLAAACAAAMFGTRAAVFADLERLPLDKYKGFEQMFAVLGSWAQIVGVGAVILVAFVLADGLLGCLHALVSRSRYPRLWAALLAGAVIGVLLGGYLSYWSAQLEVSLRGLFLSGDPQLGLDGGYELSRLAAIGMGFSMLSGGCALLSMAAAGRGLPTPAAPAAPPAS